MKPWWLVLLLVCCFERQCVHANQDAKRLLEHLLTGYNRLVRPVHNNTNVLTVRLRLKLSQLLHLHEKNQIMTTNIWLKQVWTDVNFLWNPADYGNVRSLYIPADLIWTPDIVLYNNADGNYEVTIMTKALVTFNGTVTWEPPAIYKSMCQINVQYFPFDDQECELKFGSWTYDGNEVDLVHYDSDKALHQLDKAANTNYTLVVDGIDLSDFYHSVEWDIMGAPSRRHEVRFDCCPSSYIDITFYLHLRRKTLFYTVNLIIPSVCISFLTVLAFYLPSDSGEKVSLCISILISLTFFFLLLVEIIPSTSLVIPLIGLYLLFTMVMVTLSIAVTVVTLNVHYRSPSTHTMPNWIRKVFLRWLPKVLAMSRPEPEYTAIGDEDDDVTKTANGDRSFPTTAANMRKHSRMYKKSSVNVSDLIKLRNLQPTAATSSSAEAGRKLSRFQVVAGKKLSVASLFFGGNLGDDLSVTGGFDNRSTLVKAVDDVGYIAEYFRQQNIDDEIREDWRYIATVFDRLFLWIFSVASLVGASVIMLPRLVKFDTRQPII